MHGSFMGDLAAFLLFLSQEASGLMLVLAYCLRICERRNALLAEENEISYFEVPTNICT